MGVLDEFEAEVEETLRPLPPADMIRLARLALQGRAGLARLRGHPEGMSCELAEERSVGSRRVGQPAGMNRRGPARQEAQGRGHDNRTCNRLRGGCAGAPDSKLADAYST
jgi:hypothetical protein